MTTGLVDLELIILGKQIEGRTVGMLGFEVGKKTLGATVGA